VVPSLCIAEAHHFNRFGAFGWQRANQIAVAHQPRRMLAAVAVAQVPMVLALL
jgi:hypothetical protein